MKAILMSIRPQHLVNILNGDKTIELRKRFPKDYRGWIYLYCTKAKPYLIRFFGRYFITDYLSPEVKDDGLVKNGLVVARVLVDNVETISLFHIFDKPKELGEFYKIKYRTEFEERYIPIKQAPQSWQYIYIEEDK